MPHHTPEKQHTLWLLVAAAAPIAHFSGCGWLAAGLTALFFLPVSCIPGTWDDMSKPIAILEILWFGVVAGVLLKNSALYWPSDNEIAVPLTLLTLAAVTKSAAAPRIGAVLALCMGLLAIPIAIVGAGKLEAQWLKPAFSQWPAGLALALLLPALPAEEEKGKGRIGRTALAFSLSILVQGTISLGVAASVQAPFYQTARTLGHLEPIAAVAMTLGWYALTIRLLESGRICAKGAGLDSKMATVLVWGTATILVLIRQQPEATFLMVLSAFFWVLIPFLNKMKK